MSELEAGDRRLLEDLEHAFKRGAERAGSRLACRPGCNECCIGAFPITLLDAWRLRRALDELERSDPERAARIRQRALQAARAMSEDYPGDSRSGLLAGGSLAADGFFERHASLPCPLLDPATGLCELYDARPVSCRTFGLPVRIGEEDLPPCRLCFQGAPADQIEACRVVVDPEGLEDELLEEVGRGETLIAFALLNSSAPAQLPVWSPRT